MSRRIPPQSPLAIFAWPAALALLSAAGLLIGLLADGGWDDLGWALLALPALVCLWRGLGPNR